MGDLIDKLWKPGERKKIAYRDLKNSLELINEEFRLLEDLSERISNKKRGNPEIERALRDSFLIHFRRIHNFLYSKNPDKGPIVAENFFVKGNEWRSRRIKESQIIKEMIEISNTVIPDFYYGDDALISGITKDDFKTATEEINKPFQQFIEMNLSEAVPEEETNNLKDLELIEEDAGGENSETINIDEQVEQGKTVLDEDFEVREYGADDLLYKTQITNDGNLEVLVFTKNKAVRKVINNHKIDPDYFQKNLEKYKDHEHSGKKWLAEAVMDYPTYFKENRVIFVMK